MYMEIIGKTTDMLNKTSQEFNDDLRVAVYPVVGIMAVFAVLGLIGNILVLRVYVARYPKCNFKYFVVFLALIDLLSCSVIMPLEIFTLLHWYDFQWESLCKVKSFLIVFTVSSSASALLLIAIDRFRKVWRPHGKQMLPELAVKLSVLVSLLAVIPAASDAVFWGIQTFNFNENDRFGVNVEVSMCEKDDSFKETIWPTLHTIILYSATNLVVMISTLVIYTLIAVKLFCSGPSGRLSPLSPPAIKVSTEDREDVDFTAANRESALVFRFGSDIESGLSDSDDIEKDQKVTRNSAGSLSELIDSPNSEGIELRQIRLSNGSVEGSEKPKTVRLSKEFLESPNLLRPPESPSTKKIPKPSPVMPQRFQRRRSTVASMSKSAGIRLRRKTLIMFILTAIFVGTSLVYFSMISHMASSSHFVTSLSIKEATAWFFFLRLYFINSVINPILYGFLDPRFRRALWNMGVRISFLAGSLRTTLGSRIQRGTDEPVPLRKKRPSQRSSVVGGSSG